jgi:hypothetical protein
MARNRVGTVAFRCPAQLISDALNVQVQLLNLWAGSSQLVAVGRQLASPLTTLEKQSLWPRLPAGPGIPGSLWRLLVIRLVAHQAMLRGVAQ